MTKRGWFIPVAAVALLLSGCGASDSTSAGNNGADEVLEAIEGSRDFGEYTVHFNALATSQLEPEIAARYGIVRAGNRVLLNISVLRNQDVGLATAVGADVTASARNLTGQMRNIAIREIREGSAIYYIGETEIVDSESLIFSIEALPESDDEALTLSFQRQFFVD